jgi:glycosyltransferase involved in cell wall biosynthesis
MTLNLLILARCFAIDPEDVKEGVTYRYAGLYGSLIKALLDRSPQSKVFWYSVNDQSFATINENKYTTQKATITGAFINAITETLKNKSYLTVIVAYPSSLPKILNVPEYLSWLLLLRVLNLGRIKVIVDDFDYIVEALYDVSESTPSTVLTTYYRILEKVTLMCASFVVVISEFWRKYIIRVYRLKGNKVIVLTNASLLSFMPYRLKKSKSQFVVLYSGSTMKVKNIDKLVSTIEQMRAEGMQVNLQIAGKKIQDVPSWVKIGQYNWPSFVRSILPECDVCVIPYSPSKFMFCHSVPAKLSDYMGAGKPVISTDLKEVGDIIRSSNCGLVAKDWDEFGICLRKLYNDRILCEELGNNGRATAEKHFDYEQLAEMLLDKLMEQFKKNQQT